MGFSPFSLEKIMKRILLKGHSNEEFHSKALRSSFLAVFSLVLLFFSHCRPSAVSFIPPPSQIESIEGHASISVIGKQGSARSKFSFLFQLPCLGLVSVSDFLGRTIYQIFINEERAVFTLPSKKVYWQGEEEEIIDNFLGFRLNLSEMINLLSGRWANEEERSEAMNDMEHWSFEKDKTGRVRTGQRGELRFEVKEFFSSTPVARVVHFQHPLNRGSLRVLSINFNQPVKKGAFSLSFLASYERKSWSEIERMLANEN